MSLFGKSDEQKAAEAQHQELLRGMAAGTVELAGLPEKLSSTATAAGIKQNKQEKLIDQAFRGLCDRILEDDILTPEEEQELLAVGEAVGIDNAALNAKYPDLTARIVIAGANDGRLPVDPAPQLMTKGDEEVHLELPATFLKEKVHREFRGGGSGISVPIGGGVRLRTGGFRGKSVVVGTSIEPADSGFLSVTSKRTVFQGSKKTQECRYDKLVGLQTYHDAVQLSVSTRQTPSMYGVQSGPMVAAIINTAINRLEGSS